MDCQLQGLALVCDFQGLILQVLRNDLNLANAAPGQSFFGLVENASRIKAMSFLTELKSQGAVLNWEINIAADNGVMILYFTGGLVGDSLLVTAGLNCKLAEHLYADMLSINNEQTNLLRATLKEKVELESSRTVSDSMYDEISHLNNELVSMQRELAKLNSELERRVEERTIELRISNQALEKALRVKNQFMAAMSHELRTPLTGVLGSAEVLQMPHYGTLSDRQLKAVVTIEQSGRLLLALVNDVLEFTQLQSSEISAKLESCSIGEICQSALQAISPLTAKKQQQTHFSMVPEKISIRSDECYIQKIFHHLLKNASKFTPENGEIGIEALGNLEDQELKLTVWDKGIGIQEHDLPCLFQPFAQLDPGLARQYEGSGLGLALVKQLAELLGGSVSVESIFGKGSRFSVTLPWIES
jgi:signal transduction histidine kinase